MMAAGVVGVLSVRERESDALDPQELDAVTASVPPVNPVLKRRLMELVPAPDRIVVLAGIVQLYVVAPVTVLQLYWMTSLGQALRFPVMEFGAAGAPANTVTVEHRELLVPQALMAETQIVPESALPALTLMEFPLPPEVIFIPVGTVQLYDVAPLTELAVYVAAKGAQPLRFPDIDAGVEGVDATTTVTSAVSVHAPCAPTTV